MTDQDSTTQVLARFLEAYQEADRLEREVVLDDACREHPKLEGRMRSVAEALGQLQRAASTEGVVIPGADWVEGHRLGRFEVGAKLGQGGMGAVYEGYDPELKRKVAIKVFPTPLPGSESSLARFRREGEALARMQHPHIVPVLEVGETETGQPWLVMQIIEGKSLSDLLAELPPRGQPLPESWSWARDEGYLRTIARIVLEIAGAVHHVHQQGLIHRDIKPGNILIDRQGSAILVDFGVARILDGQDLTSSRAMMGTPAFMAPEQIRDPAMVGPQTDVYGLGATLYQCLTHKLPFDASSQEEFYDAICRRDPVPPRRIRPDVPRDLETICLHAMEKQPAARYSSARALCEDLERFLENRPILARPLGHLGRSIRWVQRNRSAAAALALTLFVLVAGPMTFAFYMGAIATQERIAKERIEKESRLKEKAQALAAWRAGSLLAQRGRWDEALAQYDAAMASHPDPVQVALARIEALEGKLDAPAAIQELRALRDRPMSENQKARLYLLEADLGVNRLANPDAKLDLVDRALAMKALGPVDTLYARAMKAPTVAMALHLLRRARKLDPSHRRVNDSFGVLLMASGQARELEQFCRELRSLYPEDPTTSLLETFVHELNAGDDRPGPSAPPTLASYTEGQRRMLGFVRRAGAFIRDYDRITRDQLLDLALSRKPADQSGFVKKTLALALEANQLLKRQWSATASAENPARTTWFRILPVVARSLTQVLKESLRVLASSLFSTPDPATIIRALDHAHDVLGDGVYAQGAAMWCLRHRDLAGAASRFEQAARSRSLVLSPRTALLYLCHTRHALYLRAREQQDGRADTARRSALAAVRRALRSGVDSIDELRFLFGLGRDLGDPDLTLQLALLWRESAGPEDGNARKAVDETVEARNRQKAPPESSRPEAAVKKE